MVKNVVVTAANDAYFNLLESAPSGVLSVAEYEQEWDEVFEALKLAKQRNSNNLRS